MTDPSPYADIAREALQTGNQLVVVIRLRSLVTAEGLEELLAHLMSDPRVFSAKLASIPVGQAIVVKPE